MARKSKPIFRFLDLPPELRMRVYSYALTEDGEIGIGTFWTWDRPQRIQVKSIGGDYSRDPAMTVGLLRTCKLIHKEATPALYRDNAFRIYKYPSSEVGRFLEQIGTSVRHLRRYAIDDVSTKKERRWTFNSLKQATRLTGLGLSACLWHDRSTSEKVAKEVGPLIRSLHKSQKKLVKRRERNVLDILTVTANNGLCYICQANPGAAKKCEDEVKELVAKTLK